MNFLGIGPGELLLIIILLLVVVGPERLPGMARQTGRILVRARNWLQTSPDAALVLRARQEIEQELSQIRSSLLEVQNVRDEVMGAVKQLDDAVSPITQMQTPNLADLLKSGGDTFSKDYPAPAAPALTEDQANQAAPADTLGGADAETALTEVPEPELVPAVEATYDPALAAAQNGLPLPEAAQNGVSRSPTSAEIEGLGLRIQAVMADLFALQMYLKQRGLLDDDWGPPSHAMQLPQLDVPFKEATDE